MVQQFSTLLPQVHLTLISILQGLVLVVLFANTKPPASFSWEDITNALYVHHWYVPHLVSLLIVVTAWVEYVHGVLYLHWPMRTLWITLQFLFVVPEVAAFSSVDTIGPWMFWVGIVTLFGAIITASNRWFVSKDLYRPKHWKLVEKQIGHLNYLLLTLILPAIGVLRIAETSVFAMPLILPIADIPIQLGALFDFVVPVLMLCVAIQNLRRDDSSYGKIIEAILDDDHSLYSLRSGIIEHRAEASMTSRASDRGIKRTNRKSCCA